VALLLHKLAGTAAIFGEAALGDSAAALERALAMERNAETCVALARELLALKDELDIYPGEDRRYAPEYP
jgi:HPt (histidine-containing phosphotransfer) domain-containing protein